MLEGDIANYRHHRRPDGIHNKVLHGVPKGKPPQEGGAVLQAEFLHIGVEDAVCGKLVNLPHHPQGDGKAEGEGGHKDGGEVHRHPVGFVEEGDEGKAQGPQHRPAEGVEDGIPISDVVVEGPHLPQVDGAIEEDGVQDKHIGGDFQAHPPPQDTGQGKGEHPQDALGQHQHIVPLHPVVGAGGVRLGGGQGHGDGDKDDGGHQGDGDKKEEPFLPAGGPAGVMDVGAAATFHKKPPVPIP